MTHIAITISAFQIDNWLLISIAEIYETGKLLYVCF